MGSEHSKLQQILDYYIFQKKIKSNLRNENREDNYKPFNGYFIHPDWIKEWKKTYNYESLCHFLNTLSIENNCPNDRQSSEINKYIEHNNLYIEINLSFLIKDEGFVSPSKYCITEEILENFIDYQTFIHLNLNKKTKFEKIQYIFKKQMIILFFPNVKTIKLLIHSLAPYKDINKIINLRFVFENSSKYDGFYEMIKIYNSNGIITYLLNMNIFNLPKYEGLDEYNILVFTLYNEDFSNNNNSNSDIKNSSKDIQKREQNQNENNKNISNFRINNNQDDYEEDKINKMINNFGNLNIGINNSFNENYNLNNNNINNFQNVNNFNNNQQNNINNYTNNFNNNNYRQNENINLCIFNNNKNNYWNDQYINLNNSNINNNCNNLINNHFNNNFNNNYNLLQNKNNFNNNQNYNNNFYNNNLNENKITFNELNNKIYQLGNMLNQEKVKNNELTLKNKNLEKEVQMKNDEIKELNKELTKLKSNINGIDFKNLMTGENVIAVHFISNDSKVNRSIACKDSNIFVRIEEKLYNEYPQLKYNDNYFLVNGIKIKRFLSLRENNIKDGDNIIINSNDNILETQIHNSN